MYVTDIYTALAGPPRVHVCFGVLPVCCVHPVELGDSISSSCSMEKSLSNTCLGGGEWPVYDLFLAITNLDIPPVVLFLTSFHADSPLIHDGH